MIRLHVLLVDDDTDTRQTVEAALDNVQNLSHFRD